jgi:hypothetical protein
MADGGLDALPVPDTLFDEPDNGSYAGGGIVAFADGGMADFYDIVEKVESGGQQNAVSPKGARGVMQLMPRTMRDPGFGVRPMLADTEEENRRVGRQYLDAMYNRYGDKAVALVAYNWGPGNTDKWLKEGADPKKLPKETRDYLKKVLGAAPQAENSKTPSFAGLSTQAPDILASADKFRKVLMENTSPETKRREQMIAELESAIDPETRKAEREKRRWEALAQFGFLLAQSPGSLLQAASTAALNTLPMLREGDEQARKELRADLTALAQLEKMSNDEKREIEMLALELAKAEAGLISGERELELKYIISRMDDATKRALTALKIAADKEIARLQAHTSIDVANIQAGARKEAAEAQAKLFGLDPTGMGGSGEDVIDFSRLK